MGPPTSLGCLATFRHNFLLVGCKKLGLYFSLFPGNDGAEDHWMTESSSFTSSTTGSSHSAVKKRQSTSSPRLKIKSRAPCRCRSLTRSGNTLIAAVRLPKDSECEECKNGAKIRKRTDPARPYRKSHSAADLFEVSRCVVSVYLFY